MVCKNCKRRFSQDDSRACPRCGEVSRPASAGVLKTSTILISSGGGIGVFRSVKEMPEPLRRRLMISTNGNNSATIVIADKRGREAISQAIRRLPSRNHRKMLASFFPGTAIRLDGFLERVNVSQWIGVTVAGGAAALIWLVLTNQW